MESEEKFYQLVNTIDEMLWVSTGDGQKVLYVSPAYEKITGRSLAEFYADPQLWLRDIHPDDKQLVIDSFISLADKRKPNSNTIRICRPDGDIRTVVDNAFPIFDRNGALQRVVGTVRDITEQAKLERELQTAQKLESVGLLAAGIAHEINTPAQYTADNIRFISESFDEISSLLTLVKDSTANSQQHGLDANKVSQFNQVIDDIELDYLLEEIPLALNQSQQGIESIASIVGAMKEFSHPGTEDKELADINHIIENTVTLTKNEWKYVATVDLVLKESLPNTFCYSQKIAQAVMNLIINAAHAIADVVDQTKNELGEITISSDMTADHIVIKVGDTGSGIAPEIIDKIFDPFYTSKGVGKGTGQGLTIARSEIVDKHNGQLFCQSEVGKGSIFTIHLPLTMSGETVA